MQEDTVASRLLVKAVADGCGLKRHSSCLDLRLGPSAAELEPSRGPTESIQVG